MFKDHTTAEDVAVTVDASVARLRAMGLDDETVAVAQDAHVAAYTEYADAKQAEIDAGVQPLAVLAMIDGSDFRPVVVAAYRRLATGYATAAALLRAGTYDAVRAAA